MTTTTTDTAVVLDTPEKIHAYRELMIFTGLKAEVRSEGKMRLTRGVSCYALAKKEYGLKGNRMRVLIKLRNLLMAKYPGLDLQIF